ncbi:MAG: SAM-dependent methyltransferase [Leptolyngbyaceae cyanobacterium bins.349]|nr:SAM-dependent methyltransferase [Leptolyngbyaceae cyanobacterium bins.349]
MLSRETSAKPLVEPDQNLQFFPKDRKVLDFLQHPEETLEFFPRQETVESFTEDEVFFCPEESYFYSYCLERFVLSACSSQDQVIEFGCGDGTPVIHSLTRNFFPGVIHGYELNSAACSVANSRIEKYRLTNRYIVHNESFFDAAKPQAEYLIANPPYLPAPDEDICMPALRGGHDGSGITCQLLTLNLPSVLLMISSYSNPIDTVNHAIANGYYVADFMVSPLQFGYYSSEPKVKQTIQQLHRDRRAFFSDNIYLLAGVLFRKHHRTAIDLSQELLKVMTAL